MKNIKLPKSKHKLGFSMPEMKTFMTSEELIKFKDWFCGQTGAIAKDGTLLYYSHDVKRFLNQVRNNVPTTFD
jgi:hypothetical protein